MVCKHSNMSGHIYYSHTIAMQLILNKFCQYTDSFWSDIMYYKKTTKNFKHLDAWTDAIWKYGEKKRFLTLIL